MIPFVREKLFRKLDEMSDVLLESGGDSSREYFSSIHALLEQLYTKEAAPVQAAAGLLAEQIARGRVIHVFGVGGHSVIGCEEFFCRAGGLACINPMFEASLLLASGGMKSTMIERLPGVGDKVVRSHHPQAGEVLIITSIYGINAASVDAALEAKQRGMRVIAITSRDHAEKTPPDFPARHPSRRNLFEVADLTIDNHVPHGDTLVVSAGTPQTVGASSTILVSACVQWLCIETAKACAALGVTAPVWQSANTVGGDARNAAYVAQYAPRVRAL